MRRPDVEVVSDPLAGKLDHLVVAPGAGRMVGEVGEVGGHRLAQRIERTLVEPTALAAEQLVLHGVADQLVPEAELVVGFLGEQSALDQRA